MIWIMLLLLWAGFGFLGWGFTVGTLSKEFSYFRVTPQAIGIALLGPIGLFASLMSSHCCEFEICWQLKPKTTEERWKSFQEEGNGILGREFFDRNT